MIFVENIIDSHSKPIKYSALITGSLFFVVTINQSKKFMGIILNSFKEGINIKLVVLTPQNKIINCRTMLWSSWLEDQ